MSNTMIPLLGMTPSKLVGFSLLIWLSHIYSRELTADYVSTLRKGEKMVRAYTFATQ